MQVADPRLRTKLPCGVELKNPVLLASGCCGYGEEYAPLVDLSELGGVITEAVSMEPRAGNVPPRLRETPAGLLNCIGLQNPGVEVFCAEVVPRLLSQGTSFLVNVVGPSSDEFASAIRRIEQELGSLDTQGFKGYELDLSCPNVDSGSLFATDISLLKETVARCCEVTDALVIAKLSPNVNEITTYAAAAQQAGASCVTIANTWAGVSIDIATRQSHLARPSAGLSGPAIRPATLYHVWQCHRALPELPIIGCGGITDADSAIQYMLAGASAIQIGTGLFLDPDCPAQIVKGLSEYLDSQGEKSTAAIVGTYRDDAKT